MTISAESPTYVDRFVGGQWRITVKSSELPVVTLLLPDGSTEPVPPTFELDAAGVYGNCYTAVVLPQEPGRYIAAVTTATEGSLVFQASVAEITMNADMPDAAELDAWITAGSGGHSWSDDDLTGALAVESAAQRRVCDVPAALPPDLRESLLRRAARSLFMRRQLTELPRSDAGDFDQPVFLPPGRDPEVRRLEAPWRKLTVG